MTRVLSGLAVLSIACTPGGDGSRVPARDTASPPVTAAQAAHAEPEPQVAPVSADSFVHPPADDSAIATIGQPIPAPDPWSSTEAAGLVRRLRVSAFPGLPTEPRRALEARGCRVPQTWRGWRDQPNNLISGSFARTGQVDWAALCSDGETSRIVVHWGGEAACTGELPVVSDADAVSAMDGEVAYGRSLLVHALQAIAQDREGWAPAGVEYVYEGRASVIYACVAGQWRGISAGD